jgi:hypothetical protein
VHKSLQKTDDEIYLKAMAFLKDKTENKSIAFMKF